MSIFKINRIEILNIIKATVPYNFKFVYKFILKKNLRREWLNNFERKRNLNKIQKVPRFTEFETDILGSIIKIPDSASFVFMFNEIFSELIYKFKANSENPVIIDCGANIGLSIIYFKKLYPNSKIIGFEPDNKIFNILCSNISAFNLTDIQLINKGLWNEDGRLSFISEGADGGKINFTNENSPNAIEVTKLSKYLEEKIDFLKIDIEGAEFTVLEECKDKLHNVNLIFIEYHSFLNQEQNLDKILSILKSSSFRIFINSPGLHSKNPFEFINTYNGMDMQLNIFGIRNENCSH